MRGSVEQIGFCAYLFAGESIGNGIRDAAVQIVGLALPGHQLWARGAYRGENGCSPDEKKVVAESRKTSGASLHSKGGARFCRSINHDEKHL